jgi:two-component system cell cycle response regulator DivK
MSGEISRLDLAKWGSMNAAAPEPFVLLVEDNERNARLFAEILRTNGYRSSVASDGYQCLESVRQNRPDLILMDLQLPGLDGLAVIRKLKEESSTASIPIIAVTAHAMPEHRARLLAAGCCSYISKPISYRPFVQEIQRVITEFGNFPAEASNGVT